MIRKDVGMDPDQQGKKYHINPKRIKHSTWPRHLTDNAKEAGYTALVKAFNEEKLKSNRAIQGPVALFLKLCCCCFPWLLSALPLRRSTFFYRCTDQFRSCFLNFALCPTKMPHQILCDYGDVPVMSYGGYCGARRITIGGGPSFGIQPVVGAARQPARASLLEEAWESQTSKKWSVLGLCG
jgi:hypothetical protein